MSPHTRRELYRPRAVRIDAAPFVALYALGFSGYLLLTPKLAGVANVVVPAFVACHILTFLGCYWSLPMRCALQYRRVWRVADATLVRVHLADGGRSDMCALQHGGAPGVEETRFEHRKLTFIFAPGADKSVADEASCFVESTVCLSKPLSQYVGARGLRGEALAAAAQKYAPNAFAIPPLSFGALLVEHSLAPFFVFQVFCVLLWSLDDYWYYSLFTLVMVRVAPSDPSGLSTPSPLSARCWLARCSPSGTTGRAARPAARHVRVDRRHFALA
jgi:cation-transporting ATPase 13A1